MRGTQTFGVAENRDCSDADPDTRQHRGNLPFGLWLPVTMAVTRRLPQSSATFSREFLDDTRTCLDVAGERRDHHESFLGRQKRVHDIRRVNIMKADKYGLRLFVAFFHGDIRSSARKGYKSKIQQIVLDNLVKMRWWHVEIFLCTNWRREDRYLRMASAIALL